MDTIVFLVISIIIIGLLIFIAIQTVKTFHKVIDSVDSMDVIINKCDNKNVSEIVKNTPSFVPDDIKTYHPTPTKEQSLDLFVGESVDDEEFKKLNSDLSNTSTAANLYCKNIPKYLMVSQINYLINRIYLHMGSQ